MRWTSLLVSVWLAANSMTAATAQPGNGAPQNSFRGSELEHGNSPNSMASLALVGKTQDGLTFTERARRRQLEIERDGLRRDLNRGQMSRAMQQRKQARLREIEQMLRRLGS